MVLQMLKFNNLSESVELKWVQDTSLVDVQINILSTISRCLIFVPNISFALFFPTAEMATHYEKRNIFLFDSLRNSEDNSCQISYRLEYLKNDRFNLRVFAFSMSTHTDLMVCFFSSKNHFKWCTWSFFSGLLCSSACASTLIATTFINFTLFSISSNRYTASFFPSFSLRSCLCLSACPHHFYINNQFVFTWDSIQRNGRADIHFVICLTFCSSLFFCFLIFSLRSCCAANVRAFCKTLNNAFRITQYVDWL